LSGPQLEQRELAGFVRVGFRGDEGAQLVAIGEHTVVPDQVKAWCRDKGRKAGEEGVCGDVGEGGAVTSGLLEVDSDLSVR